MLTKVYKDQLTKILSGLPGRVSMVYRNLCEDDAYCYQEHEKLIAASVIKLPMMITLFDMVQKGAISWDEEFSVTEDVKVPSCGALTYMHEGLRVTLRDLCTLMIILSDNTATNMVFDRIGAERVNEMLRCLGCTDTTLRRKMFDAESSRKGIQNHITASEIALLLEKLARGQCISPDADREMLQILSDQRLNGKIPFYLHAMDIDVAHKTGEDSGTTHDVAVVLTEKPFVLCFASNDTDVPAFERIMQDIARDLAMENNR